MQEQAEELQELQQIKTANYIASMCIKAGKFDRALSFFTKARANWKQFDEEQRAQPSRDIYTKLAQMPYSHLHFNFGNYYMNFKQAMEAADLYYVGLETSPFRYSSEKKATVAAEEEPRP